MSSVQHLGGGPPEEEVFKRLAYVEYSKEEWPAADILKASICPRCLESKQRLCRRLKGLHPGMEQVFNNYPLVEWRQTVVNCARHGHRLAEFVFDTVRTHPWVSDHGLNDESIHTDLFNYDRANATMKNLQLCCTLNSHVGPSREINRFDCFVVGDKQNALDFRFASRTGHNDAQDLKELLPMPRLLEALVILFGVLPISPNVSSWTYTLYFFDSSYLRFLATGFTPIRPGQLPSHTVASRLHFKFEGSTTAQHIAEILLKYIIDSAHVDATNRAKFLTKYWKHLRDVEKEAREARAFVSLKLDA